MDEETWNTVQRLMGTKRRAPKRQNTPNRLTGLLYCADCGTKLTHRSSLVQGKYLDDAFVCSSYRQLTRDCTMHYIPTAKMEAAILAAIQRVSWYVRHNEASLSSVCGKRRPAPRERRQGVPAESEQGTAAV